METGHHIVAEPIPSGTLEHTLVDVESASSFSLLGNLGGRPSLLCGGTPIWEKYLCEGKENFSGLVKSVDNWERSSEEIEKVRKKLEDLGLYGHSITVDNNILDHRVSSERMAAYNLFHVAIFGLWPRQHPYKDAFSYLGEFGKFQNQLAGDHFEGFAVLVEKEHETVAIAHDGTYFIPPKELTLLVPNEEIRHGLVRAIQLAGFIDQGKLKDMDFYDRIITFEDVLDME